MRHGANMLAAMEGISRPVFRITKELTQNSRSGLTVRFLSKKLELPEEEVEYLVELNHDFLYTDLTKIRLVPEGFPAVKRISDGLENLGDVPSLYRGIKSLSPHDFRRLEEQLDIDRPGAKKAVAEELILQVYCQPDSIVEYVAARGFSTKAREVFDIVWQLPGGLMPVSKIRAAWGGTAYDVEQALWELVRGLALFEMFRFDAEDRLIRVAGLLSEIRQWREESNKNQKKRKTLKTTRSAPAEPESRDLEFSDAVCRLVASMAAKAARLRGDGELFREDQRRLSDIVPEDAEPSLATCLWAAQGLGWIARVDNELKAGPLEELLPLSRYDRHRLLFNWLMTTGNEGESRRILSSVLDELKGGAWCTVMECVKFVSRAQEENAQFVLKAQGGHYRYVSPTAASGAEKTLARSIEETLAWLGVVEKSSDGLDTYFRVTNLGRSLLSDVGHEAMRAEFAKRAGEIIVQPNFDIVVPTQDMDPLLVVPLDQFAVRQSTGRATVYHLGKESFTEALQEGHDGDAFVSFLLAHNRGGTLPSNVMMTLDDWRGGLRRVRIKTIQVIEADDSLVMADLMHRRKFAKFFTPIDSQRTIGYGKVTKAELAKQLEKDGFIVE